jgi:hypothetical protein
MDATTDAELRDHLRKLLEGGVETRWWQRAYGSEEIGAVVRGLREVAPGDHVAMLKAAGFTAHPYRPTGDAEVEQCCSTCMYFEHQRQYCNLPELALPVKPHWSCILWRL